LIGIVSTGGAGGGGGGVSTTGAVTFGFGFGFLLPWEKESSIPAMAKTAIKPEIITLFIKNEFQSKALQVGITITERPQLQIIAVERR
jgi:hypothetical protein